MNWISSSEWVAYGEPKYVDHKNDQRSKRVNQREAEKHGLRVSVTAGITYYHCNVCGGGWLWAKDAVNCHKPAGERSAMERAEMVPELIECIGESKDGAMYVSLRRAGELLGLNSRATHEKKRLWEFASDHELTPVTFSERTTDSCIRGYYKGAFLKAKEKTPKYNKIIG
jgi:hypothetical protein